MPLPWGRLFWTFVVGLCAGIVGYAIYRGDLRWELPAETALRASQGQEQAAEPSLAPEPDLEETVQDLTPSPVEPPSVGEDDPDPDTEVRPPADEEPTAADDEDGALIEDELLLPPVEAAAAESAPAALRLEAGAPAAVASAPTPEPKPASVESVADREPGRDFLIVPGERVGQIVPGMTETQLEDLYGPGNVSPVEVSLGEGFSEPGTALFASDPQRSIEILWSSSKPNRRPRLVRVKGRAWRTAEGIGLGTTLRQLEALNDGPFTLSGFGWDYSGAVVSWGDGKLGPLLQSSGRVQLWLAPPKSAKPGKLVGDKDFKSNNPAMRTLDPRVYALTVEFPADEAAAKR